MSSKAQKKEEVKKNLRSLLLSAPAALTIDELKRDYHDFIMEPIPFRALGYVTIEDLLKDMSDALYVTWKKGVMCVAGIADSNTAHIQKLVSKQKVANKNKWATLRKGGPPPQRHKTQQPRPLPTVPPFIRNYLTQLFKSYPDGLPFTHFDAAFSKRFNIQIDPIRLGFTSLRELLKSVPYILEVKELQNGEVRVCPVSKSCKFIKARNEDDKMYFDNLIDLWHEIVSLNNLEFEFYSFFLADDQPSQSREQHPFYKPYTQNLPPRLERQRSLESKDRSEHPVNSAFSWRNQSNNEQQLMQSSNPPQSVGRGIHCRLVNIDCQLSRHIYAYA